jgi:putative ABC transport system permease protein
MAVSAVFSAGRSGIRGRKLQAAIIAVVLLAATATSVVAVGLLANAHGPFDRAFARQDGADITAAVDPSAATPAQITATTRLPGVAAAAGPYSGVSVTAQVTTPGLAGSSSAPLRIIGRSAPGGSVDDLTVDQGKWPASNGQIVMGRGTGIFAGSVVTVGSQKLTVVGIAVSVTGSADAWVLPSEVARLAGPASPAQAQMLYRFANAGSTSAITADTGELRAALPRGALLNAVSYLGQRQAEESNIAPWVPFIIAFGVIALVISVLIVVNVISGAVTAGTTRIGVLKSIGFTAAQVVAAYVLLVANPALVGCIVGVLFGNVLAIPLLKANAHVYQMGTLTVPYWVDGAVPLAALALTVIGAVPSAARAGRMSAVQAIASGRAPRSSRGYLAHRMLARMNSLPRSVTLGLAAPFARPARTMMTVVAILFGAVAVTFGAGLAISLDRVVTDGPSTALPVTVSLNQSGRGQSSLTAARQHAVVSVLAAQKGTSHYVTETDDQLTLPGLSDSASVTAYGGNPAWSGYALISGRWYSSFPNAAEVDVNTLFLTDTGTSVGSAYSLESGGHRVNVRIVGEVFNPGKNINMHMSPTTLAAVDPSASLPQQYDVAVQPGTSPQAYANTVSAALGNSYQASASTGQSNTLTAVLALVATLTILIMVVAGLGVLDTVALQIRERAHDIGVYKSIGMTPRQTLAMVVCSVAFVGLIAGIVAIPAGVYLHHGVVPVMAHAANSGYPSSLVSVYASWQLVLLGLAGLGSGGPHCLRAARRVSRLGARSPRRPRLSQGARAGCRPRPSSRAAGSAAHETRRRRTAGRACICSSSLTLSPGPEAISLNEVTRWESSSRPRGWLDPDRQVTAGHARGGPGQPRPAAGPPGTRRMTGR